MTLGYSLLNEETFRKIYNATENGVFGSYRYISGLIDGSLFYKEIEEGEKNALDLLNDTLYDEYKNQDRDE